MKNKIYFYGILSCLLMSSFAWGTAHIETTLKIVLKDLETLSKQKSTSYLYEVRVNDTSLQNKESPYQNTFPPFTGKFHTPKETGQTLKPIKLKLAANLAAPEISINLMEQKNKQASVFHATCLISQEQWDQILNKLPAPAILKIIFNPVQSRCDIDMQEISPKSDAKK